MKLILLPGMDGTGLLFADFIQVLPDTIDPVVVSYPQYERLSYSQLVALVERQLPVSGDYVILGESFSGPVAISLAAKSPPGLKGLILCCTFAINPKPLFTLLGSMIPVSIVPERLRNWMLLGRNSSSSLELQTGKVLQTIPDGEFKQRIREVHTCNKEDLLGAIGVPVLYLRASNDRLIPKKTASEIASNIQQCNVIDMEGPHMLLQAKPVETSKAVSNFIHDLQRV